MYPLNVRLASFWYNKSGSKVWLNYNEVDVFASTLTNQICKINLKFNCSDKTLIDLLTYKKCLIQYMGETVDGFRLDGTTTKIIPGTMIVVSQ